MYDILIIGGASSGAYFAKKMALKGYSVKIIEKASEDRLGDKMDIFHIPKTDFKRFDLPVVKEGDAAWAFEFDKNFTSSPYNNYPKRTYVTTVGLHMHEYFEIMVAEAVNAGAEIEYNATFKEFVLEKKKIVGVKYVSQGKEKSERAKVVIDASGLNAVGRCSLPKDYGIETFKLSAEDMFYVVLYYVYFHDGKDYHSFSNGWPFYKTWVAPCADSKGAILGIGACHSFEYAEKVFAQFKKDIELPEYTVDHVEKGATPYTRAPYSTVGDNFIVTGDAACLTKPNCGEGVVSSMVHIDIAADVLDKALKKGDTSKEALWEINTRYIKAQGADFESTRAILTKAVRATRDEFEYFFKKDIIFSEKFMNGMSEGPEIKVTVGDILHIAGGILGGLFTGKFSFKTLKVLVSGLLLNGKVKKHYLSYPTSPEGLEEWSKDADKLWEKVGKMQ